MRLGLPLLVLMFFVAIACGLSEMTSLAQESSDAAAEVEAESDAAAESAESDSESAAASSDPKPDDDSSPNDPPDSDDEPAGGGVTADDSFSVTEETLKIAPVVLLIIGIVSVLGLIIGLKLNAFLALIISALIVSLGVGLVEGESMGGRMSAVVDAFGSAAGKIGIVIAMAAIIGKCMLDSGAADRIVHSAINVTGEKKASLGLMLSGFILAIPVFFDTVFYLLVPLARSLHRRTKRNYLRYLMAIATGGAITHTLVPPTPGPLLVSAILGVEIGVMMMIGTLVAVPAAIVGLIYSIIVDKMMPVEMRPLGATEDKHQSLPVDKLPSLTVSLLPVLLPVVLIGAGTLAVTVADREDAAKLTVEDIPDFARLASVLSAAEPSSPAGRVVASSKLSPEERAILLQPATDDYSKTAVVDALNKVLLDDKFYNESAFLGVPLTKVSKDKIKADQERMKPVDRRRMNRSLLEDAYPTLIHKHVWDTDKRKWSNRLGLWSNANFALMLAAICAMLTLKVVRSLSWRSLGEDVEESLMSGGVIILITAAGGAFGAMLAATHISDTIKAYFSQTGASGIELLLLAWGIAAVLKIAQGSSTVAMIVGAGMMAAIIGDAKPEYHMVYVALAVGTGSLLGSWMNDSGFWVFTKMGGLTEGESLRSWTPLLVVLSVAGLAMTIALSELMPMSSGL